MLSEIQLKKAQQRIAQELKDNPLWKITVMDKFWLCPYCGDVATQVERTSTMVGEILYHFLHKCSGWANFTGNYLNIRELKIMRAGVETRHRIIHDPQWKNFDAFGNWYCPYCLNPVPTDFIQKREVTQEVQNKVNQHLSSCRPYKKGKLQPLENIRKLVEESNRIKHLAIQIKRVVADNPRWGEKDPQGTWICPFCEETQSGVDVSSKLLLTETAPNQIAAHLVKRCVVYQREIGESPDQLLLNPPERLQLHPEKNISIPDKEINEREDEENEEQEGGRERLETFVRLPEDIVLPTKRAETISRLSPKSPPVKPATNQAKKRKKSSEILKKARMQMVSLLPSLPEIPGYEFGYLYRPSRKIQGDLIQIFPLSDGKVVFSISEVSRQKMDAVYLNEKLVIMLQQFIKETQSPKEILCALNEHFLPEFHSETFITMFLGVVDTNKEVLSFANAGHHTPILYNPNRSKHLIFLRSNGLVIGGDQPKVFKKSIEESSQELLRDDLVVMYTTGIIEVKDKTGTNSFGQDKFHNMIELYGKKGVDFFLKMTDLSIQEFTHNPKCEKEHDLTVLSFRFID